MRTAYCYNLISINVKPTRCDDINTQRLLEELLFEMVQHGKTQRQLRCGFKSCNRMKLFLEIIWFFECNRFSTGLKAETRSVTAVKPFLQ